MALCLFFFFFLSHDACAVFFPILIVGLKINVSVYAQLEVSDPQNSGGPENLLLLLMIELNVLHDISKPNQI